MHGKKARKKRSNRSEIQGEPLVGIAKGRGEGRIDRERYIRKTLAIKKWSEGEGGPQSSQETPSERSQANMERGARGGKGRKDQHSSEGDEGADESDVTLRRRGLKEETNNTRILRISSWEGRGVQNRAERRNERRYAGKESKQSVKKRLWKGCFTAGSLS